MILFPFVHSQKIYYIISRMSEKIHYGFNSQDNDQESVRSDESESFQELSQQIDSTDLLISHCQTLDHRTTSPLSPKHNTINQSTTIKIEQPLSLSELRQLQNTQTNMQPLETENSELKKCLILKQNQILEFRQAIKNIEQKCQLLAAENSELKEQVCVMRARLVQKQKQVQCENQRVQQQKQILEAKLQYAAQMIFGVQNLKNYEQSVSSYSRNLYILSEKINEIYCSFVENGHYPKGMKPNTPQTINFMHLKEKLTRIDIKIEKMRNQITAHRDYTCRLEKQIESLKQNGALKNWFEPVIKLCKGEENGPQRRNKQPKNSK